MTQLTNGVPGGLHIMGLNTLSCDMWVASFPKAYGLKPALMIGLNFFSKIRLSL